MPVLPITLDEGFVPVIQLSDTVHVGQILATRVKPTEVSIALADELGVPVKKVGQYLKKNPGDSVVAGEEIAVKKNFFGKVDAEIISKFSGIVTRFEREKGILSVKPAGQPAENETLNSPIDGVITLCNNEKILLETDKHFVVGKRGRGNQTSQVMLFVHTNKSDAVQSYELDASSIGSIILGRYFPREILIKAVSMGVAGIIGTKFLDDDLQYLEERKIDIPFIEIEETDLPKLSHWHGKSAYMHGDGKTIILLHT